MDITLMINSAENNKIGKKPMSVRTVSGTLKDESSIINPTITLDYDLSALPNINYMYIPIWKRYYFITNISSYRSALCVIDGHVDVLESFKDEILENVAVVRRQENQWNLYIDDGLFHVYQNQIIEGIDSTSDGFSGTTRVLVLAG